MLVQRPPLYESKESEGMKSWFQLLWKKFSDDSHLTSGTVINTTSGTSHDFLNIPSWVKRITVSLVGVSTNGTSNIQIQLGDSGGVENTGYAGTTTFGTTHSLWSAGAIFATGLSAASIVEGSMVFTLVNPTTNTWAVALSSALSNGATAYTGGGSKSLSATLDRVRLTTVNGTDTFDAGSVNISYE